MTFLQNILIAPSVLAADFLILGEECIKMESAGADMLHVDIMDGCFVPNISMGIPVLQALRRACRLPMDVHLMITSPLTYIESFYRAGASRITFHVEAQDDVDKTLDAIHSFGIPAGIVLKPSTPAERAFPYIKKADTVMVMTVEPGFGGQKFMAEMLPKIEAIRTFASKNNRPDLDIEVDGGIDQHTAPMVIRAGANVLVSGSALFGKADYGKAISDLRIVDY